MQANLSPMSFQANFEVKRRQSSLQQNHIKVNNSETLQTKPQAYDITFDAALKARGELDKLFFKGLTKKRNDRLLVLNQHDLKLIKDMQISNPPDELAMLKRGLLFRPNNVNKPLDETLKERIKPVTITTEDGKKLKCWYIPPKEKGGMTILYSHGNASPLPLMQDVAKELVGLNDDLGVGALMLEYRGFGENKDVPLFQEAKDIYRDVEGGFDFLRKQGIPENNIISWGLSLGGVPATEIAVNHKDIKGLILESTFTNNNEVFQGNSFLGFLKEQGLLTEHEAELLEKSPDADKIIAFLAQSEFFNYRPVDKMANTKGIPTLIIHSGKNDNIIPQSMAERLYDVSPNTKDTITPETLKDGAPVELHISKNGNHRFRDESSTAKIRNFVSLLSKIG